MYQQLYQDCTYGDTSALVGGLFGHLCGVEHFGILVLVLLTVLVMAPSVCKTPHEGEEGGGGRSPIADIFSTCINNNCSSLLRGVSGSSVPNNNTNVFNMNCVVRRGSGFRFHIKIRNVCLGSAAGVGGLRCRNACGCAKPKVIRRPVGCIVSLRGCHRSRGHVSLGVPLVFNVRVRHCCFLLNTGTKLNLIKVCGAGTGTRAITVSRVLISPVANVPGRALSACPTGNSNTLGFKLSIATSTRINVSLSR